MQGKLAITRGKLEVGFARHSEMNDYESEQSKEGLGTGEGETECSRLCGCLATQTSVPGRVQRVLGFGRLSALRRERLME
jgi:hypothetical protein